MTALAVPEPRTAGAYSPVVAEQYLTFMLGKDIYALGILNIKEIIGYETLTEVPMMPPFVRGVINLRGNAVPVIDLITRFGKGATVIARRTGIVIAEAVAGENSQQKQDIGIIVDAVNEVADISRNDIEPPPDFGVGLQQAFISGMARQNDKFVKLLNVNRILTVQELANIEDVNSINLAELTGSV